MKASMAVRIIGAWFALVSLTLVWLVWGDVIGLRYHPGAGGMGLEVDSWLLVYGCAIPPTLISALAFLNFGFAAELAVNIVFLAVSGYLALGLLFLNRAARRIAQVFVALNCLLLLLFLGHVIISGPFYLPKLRFPVLAGGLPSLLFHVLIFWQLTRQDLGDELELHSV